MKKVLFAVAAVALLSVAAQAGEIKYHNWPTGGFIPQELTTIPVKMDVGYWVRVKDQDKLEIKLAQEDVHTYSGCVDMVVESNFNLTLTATISKATGSPIGGDFSVTLNGGSSANVDAPGATVTVCAKLSNADLKGSTGGAKNVQVAVVKIKVVPRT